MVSVLIYLDLEWGGAQGTGNPDLFLLRSKRLEDVAEEVPAFQGNLVAFRNANHAWHGLKPYSGPRRAVQLNFER